MYEQIKKESVTGSYDIEDNSKILKIQTWIHERTLQNEQCVIENSFEQNYEQEILGIRVEI
jgi:hypothetical protein